MQTQTIHPAQAGEPELLPPSLGEIRCTAARIAEAAMVTPVHAWRGPRVDAFAPKDAELILKLELLQRTGTFKARAALNGALALDPDQVARGVTTISAGNHAVGVAYAAAVVGASARVVMMDVASPAGSKLL